MSHNTRDVKLGKPEVRVAFTQQDVARFWSKVDRSGACWLWTSNRTGSLGYGQFGVMAPGADRRRLNYYAHRVAWELSHGAIPDGQQIRHQCDNPICVNPEHLLIGTHTDNMRDASERSRLRVPHPNARKLTPSQRRKVAVDYLAGDCTQQEIGDRYGVTRQHVMKLVSEYVISEHQHRRAS